MQIGTNYGYVRVSTKKQNEDRQLIALAEYGILPRNIFIDKKSGKDFERQKYQRLLKRLKQGDVIFVESIDRFGRNYEEITEQWRFITKKIGADIVVLDMPLLDTRQRDLDLTGVFITDLVLQILSYVAEKEKQYNHQRQAEGIAAAKAKGVKFGRPPLEKPERFTALYDVWAQGEISARAAALELGITHRTFTLWAVERSAMITG